MNFVSVDLIKKQVVMPNYGANNEVLMTLTPELSTELVF